MSKKALEHNSRDEKFKAIKHVIDKSHKYPYMEDYNIIGKSYCNNSFKRKVAEFLSIKDIRPIYLKHTRQVYATKVI